MVLWRRRARGALWVLLTPAMVVTVGAVITYGQTRFRAAAEPSLALLAAVGAVAAIEWFRRHAVDAQAPHGRHTVTACTCGCSSNDRTEDGGGGRAAA